LELSLGNSVTDAHFAVMSLTLILWF
jgi:hypothetical protein